MLTSSFKVNFAVIIFVAVFLLFAGSQTQAATKCGSFNKPTKSGSCLKGTPTTAVFIPKEGAWEWYCDLERCLYKNCGDNLLDFGELCDKNNLNNKTCLSFPGYTGGTLLCKSDCSGYDFSQCIAIIPPPISPSPSSPPPPPPPPPPPSSGGCKNSVKSLWSAPFLLDKNCCGELNEKIVQEINPFLDLSRLCSGGRIAKNFREMKDANGILEKWQWDCGSEDCLAYKKAECAPGISAEGYGCNPSFLFQSKEDYLKVLAEKKKINAVNPLCVSGTQIQDYDYFCPKDFDKSLNALWYCQGLAPAGQKNEVHCEVGWATDSKCGFRNKQTYTTEKDFCQDDAVFKNFFKLIDEGDNYGLCDRGSKVFLNSKEYWWTEGLGTKPVNTAEYDGFDITRFTYFSWKCYSYDKKTNRNGKVIDCKAYLDKQCQPKDAACGNAVKKKYAYFGLGPERDFCERGKLGG